MVKSDIWLIITGVPPEALHDFRQPIPVTFEAVSYYNGKRIYFLNFHL
jgi:hypothetical protein